MALKALLLKKELDAKRSAMTKLDRAAEFETRTAELEQAIGEITEENTPEEREAISAEVDKLETEKTENEAAISQLREEIEKLEAALSEAEAEQTVPVDNRPEERNNNMTLMEIRSNDRYVDKYAEYIKGNIDERELRTVLTELAGADALGDSAGIPVPVVVSEIVETAWEKDEIMSLVKKTYFKGIFKQAFEVSASPASIHLEGGDPVAEETLIHGIVTMTPVMIKKWVSVSDEVLANNSEFLRYVYEELTYQIVKFISAGLLAAIAEAGLTSDKDFVGLPAVEVTALGLGDMFAALGELTGRATDITAVMNRKTWAAYKALQLSANYPVDIFAGIRVAFDDSLPAFDDASEGDVFAIVGDFRLGARANFPNGDTVDIIIDPYSAKKRDLVEVLGKEYVAIGVVVPNSFCRLAKTAGN